MSSVLFCKIFAFFKYAGILFVIFLLCIIIRVFLFEIYYIPSESMENSLYKGDIILVSKVHYGARIPNSLSDIPWLNLFQKQTDDSDDDILSKNRITGVKKISRNDILVFNTPNSNGDYMIKRCMALPGDTIVSSNDGVIVNGIYFIDVTSVKKKYVIHSANSSKTSIVLNRFHIPYEETRYQKVNGYRTVYLTQEQKIILLNNVDKSTIIELDTINNEFKQKIPQKGDSISQMDLIPKELFKYENLHNAGVIKHNYYFFLGDNRSSSFDSRFIGLVPDKYIVGKAVIVLFSIDKNKLFRKERCFKLIK